MLALSLVACNGCPPALVLYQEHTFTKAIQDLQPLLSVHRSRTDMKRSTILTLTSHEHDNLSKLTSGFNEYGQFVRSAPIRRIPMVANLQDDMWTEYQQGLQFLSSRSSGRIADYPNPFFLQDILGLQPISSDVHLLHVVSTDSRFSEETESLLQKVDHDLLHDLPWSVSIYTDGQFPPVCSMANMKNMAPVYPEVSLLKTAMQWRNQNILVPQFRWNDTIELEDHIYQSSLKFEAVTVAPLKSPEKVKPKTFPKRKNKKSGRERDSYKSNSIHACESLLSLMMDKKRNGKSVLNFLKKSGPELPQFLTQFSASIAGTGLAVMFSVVYKVACGNAPFCISSFLTSGLGMGLFWVSWAVNNLRNTIVYISKNSARLCLEEREMMMRVDKGVEDIFFRAFASMVLLVLRFS